MANVTGPRGKLFSDIDARLKKPRRKKAPPSEDKVVVRETRHDKYLMKSTEDYNCNDLELLIREQWKSIWPMNPQTFVARDRSTAKRLLKEQGGERVVTMIKYVFNNWGDMQKRYRIQGYPNMGLLYGFRSSWIPESVEGKKTAPPATAEYTKSETQDGEWF